MTDRRATLTDSGLHRVFTSGLRLGIDLDGVVADFTEGWTRLYRQQFGHDVHVDDVRAWNAPVQLTHFGSMKEFWRWAASANGDVSLFRHLDPYPGALEALGRLSQSHRVVVLTTKPHFAVHDTLAWLAEHRIPSTEIHMVDDKSTVRCDVYLDDADHNLKKIVRHHPTALVCRYVRPWNRPHRGVVDVSNWQEFEDVVASGRPSQ